jgi:hypothetical protein
MVTHLGTARLAQGTAVSATISNLATLASCASPCSAMLALGEARQSLSYLLESAVEQQEKRLRNAVAIPIRQVLEEVGLIPHNLAEQIEQETCRSNSR